MAITLTYDPSSKKPICHVRQIIVERIRMRITDAFPDPYDKKVGGKAPRLLGKRHAKDPRYRVTSVVPCEVYGDSDLVELEVTYTKG